MELWQMQERETTFGALVALVRRGPSSVGVSIGNIEEAKLVLPSIGKRQKIGRYEPNTKAILRDPRRVEKQFPATISWPRITGRTNWTSIARWLPQWTSAR